MSKRRKLSEITNDVWVCARGVYARRQDAVRAAERMAPGPDREAAYKAASYGHYITATLAPPPGDYLKWSKAAREILESCPKVPRCPRCGELLHDPVCYQCGYRKPEPSPLEV